MENADLTQISIDQAIACLQNLEYTQIIENGISSFFNELANGF